MKKVMISAISLLVLLSLVIPVLAPPPTVPPQFKVTKLADGLDQPKGIISALHRAGAGRFGHDLYVAVSGANHIVKVDKAGAGASYFAGPGMLSFPVGVAFFGGTFGKYLYVGNAFTGGIVKVDPSGAVSPFALAGVGIAGLDFGRGPYGHYLYAGEWSAGNIWQVDAAGNAVLFSSVFGTQTRYLKFSHGNGFGTFLYFTDIIGGNIYKVAPDGTATLFASIGVAGLEGLAFSPGGAFGHFLYAGSLLTGDIYRVAPDGTWILWASGFGGAADIHFEPGKKGGFTMYVVTGQGDIDLDGVPDGKVYAISKK